MPRRKLIRVDLIEQVEIYSKFKISRLNREVVNIPKHCVSIGLSNELDVNFEFKTEEQAEAMWNHITKAMNMEGVEFINLSEEDYA